MNNSDSPSLNTSDKIDDDSDSETINNSKIDDDDDIDLDESEEIPDTNIDEDELETDIDNDINSENELNSDDELTLEDDIPSESGSHIKIETNDSKNNIQNYSSDNQPQNRISRQILTKYELTQIVGIRTQQFQRGAKPLVEFTSLMSYEDIVLKEITEKKSPFIIRRPLPNNVFEDFKVSELELINY